MRIIKESKTQNKKAFLFTYSFNKYLLNVYYVPDTVLGSGDTAEKEKLKSMELTCVRFLFLFTFLNFITEKAMVINF